jgi:hypothetical protein
MSRETLDAIRQVLVEATCEPHFFDLSDAERLNWMIARAFQIGSQQKSNNGSGNDHRTSGRKNRN